MAVESAFHKSVVRNLSHPAKAGFNVLPVEAFFVLLGGVRPVPTVTSVAMRKASSLCFLPQSHIALTTGFRLIPNGVREYSTLGGTWAYTWRCTKPSRS